MHQVSDVDLRCANMQHTQSRPAVRSGLQPFGQQIVCPDTAEEVSLSMVKAWYVLLAGKDSRHGHAP